jgi:hypothetical protein
MPLRDHFRPPVEKRHSWDELHGGWPMIIVQKLFPQLPDGFVAAPGVHLGTAFEIDVSTYEQDEPVAAPMPGGSGGGPPRTTAAHADAGNRIARPGRIRGADLRRASRPAVGRGDRTVQPGQPLPTLPIWLDVDLSIDLELESSYKETCRLLRIS